VGDSLTDTTFTYTEADTTRLLAFVVVVVDSMGQEGAASDETPAVTGVTPGTAATARGPIRAYPNPTRATIRFEHGELPVGPATVEIFDVTGRRVHMQRILWANDGWVWDGRDARGRSLESGIYLVRIASGTVEQRSRVVLVR
jgi:hypothetical protein